MIPELEQNPMPDRLKGLPRDPRGYPVPAFVEWLDGVPLFEVMNPRHMLDAVKGGRCWICGMKLGVHKVFVVGPMCCINRVSGEPPSHLECAEYAARVCPFLSRPHMKRPERDRGVATVVNADMSLANPGVTILWSTRSYTIETGDQGMPLFIMGEPGWVRWYAKGRLATVSEARLGFRAGVERLLPSYAQAGDEGLKQFETEVAWALRLLPTEEG